MTLPAVPNTIKDEAAGITYVVLAYRQLTRPEIVMAVRHYMASQGKGRKPLRRGSQVKIITTIGQ